MSRVHIEIAGEIYRIDVNGNQYRFEDHRYCGPMFCDKDGEEINQPKESSNVWTHINAWYQQGKKFKVVGKDKWCVYETESQIKRNLKGLGL